jgi:hypothetical protein
VPDEHRLLRLGGDTTIRRIGIPRAARIRQLTVQCAGRRTVGTPPCARLWQQHELRHKRGERKPFRHPWVVGEFTLTTEILCLEDGQRMTTYQAEPGTRQALHIPICSRQLPNIAALEIAQVGGSANALATLQNWLIPLIPC